MPDNPPPKPPLQLPPEWKHDFRVRAYETGPDGRVSVQMLCNYLQEAASGHARALAVAIEDLGAEQLTWVLGRLQLRVRRLPRWQESVRVETWPSGLRGFYVLRDFLVWDGDGEPAVRATSTWFVIDLERRRAVRVPVRVREIPRPERERALAETWKKLPRLVRVDHERRFDVRRSDLDVNVHVNHVSYLEWAMETLPPELAGRRRLVELEIDFLTELTYGDTVLAQAEVDFEGDPQTALIRLARASDDSEAARVWTAWT